MGNIDYITDKTIWQKEVSDQAEWELHQMIKKGGIKERIRGGGVGREGMEISGLDSFQIAHRLFLPAEGCQW
jgi:hypothetical protein